MTTRDREKLNIILEGRKMYQEAYFDNPNLKETDCLRFLRDEFPKTNLTSCLLIGGVGSGKTFAALAYITHHCKKYEFHPGVNASFIKAFNILEKFIDRKFNWLDDIKSRTFLLIDDLGTEPPGYKGADFVAFFENLFIERYEKGKTTLLTSNLQLEQVREMYGDRFLSRLRDSGVIFETTGPDLRGKKVVQPVPVQ